MAIKLDAEDIKPLLHAVGLGEDPNAAPRPQVDALPPPPMAPPPPTPASAGFAAYASDPQNAAKVANSLIKPGQPITPPNAGTAALQAGQGATHSPADPSLPPPVVPQTPSAIPQAAMTPPSAPNVTQAPAMASYADWSAANPSQVAKPTYLNHGGGFKGFVGNALDVAVPGLLGAAGGLHGDPGAGARYVADRVAADRGVPELNQQRYQAAVVTPAKEAAAIADTQSQAGQRQGQENRANAQAQKLLSAPPEKQGDPSKTVETAEGVYQFNPDTGKFDTRVGGTKTATKTDDEKLGDQAQHLNGIWDTIAKKHGLPVGQFTPDMTRADAKELSQSFNNVLSAGRGDTHITIEQAKDAASNAKSAPLNQDDPAMKESVAAVANGSVKLQDVFGRGATTAQKAQFVASVKAINPNYNSGDHDIENKVRQYMTSGQGGASIGKAQTLNKHLDAYEKAADAMHNGDFPAINKIGNELGLQMGSDAKTNMAVIQQAAATEAASLYKNGVPDAGEIAGWKQTLNGDGSTLQMHNGAKTVRMLAQGKLETLKDQSDAGAKGQANFDNSNTEPADGATKKNSHGDTVTYHKGKGWQL